jgi:serine/threonine-protein kinase
MADQDDLAGRRLGEFVVRELIDEGGFGSVHSCEQPMLGRAAVIKVLRYQLRRRDVIVRRFLREAKLASLLDHPYAAHIYAFGIEERDKLLWIAMERVQGVTLDRAGRVCVDLWPLVRAEPRRRVRNRSCSCSTATASTARA